MSTDFNEDTILLNWQEASGCQVWRTLNKEWTAAIRHPKKYIQPTKPTLREALEAARREWFRLENI